MTENTTRKTFRPLGTETQSAYYGQDVVGDVEQSIAGNSILRVGPCTPGHGWEQKAHIVLTPNERETLIGRLLRHRESAPATRPSLSDVIAEAQLAQDAASGDSNDEEIDLLRSALEVALSALGLDLPEGVDPDDEE